MKIIFSVEKFGKIKEANIDISNYTVFVGDNNTGKTMLMQLIYGILRYAHFPDEFKSFHAKNILLQCRNNLLSKIGQKDLILVINDINDYLSSNKDILVEKIFKKRIYIGALRFNVEIDDELYISHKINSKLSINDNNPEKYEAWSVVYKEKQLAFYGIRIGEDYDGKLLNMLLFSMGIGQQYRLFLPSSRAGIQLLYKDFYAEKVGKIFAGAFDGDNIEDWGLTQPVYDFMNFLQTNKSNLEAGDKEIVKFIENELIDGRLSFYGDEIVYFSKEERIMVPLYLSSSMINEIAPLMMAMSDDKFYDFVFLDEAETSLHPKKQKQLVRLFTRINNMGTRVLLSTHSDTMASYLYLIYVLSTSYGLSNELFSRLCLNEMDVLNRPNMHFYQFEDCGDFSNVEELNIDDTGINFKLFNESLDNLYEMTELIIGRKDDF